MVKIGFKSRLYRKSNVFQNFKIKSSLERFVNFVKQFTNFVRVLNSIRQTKRRAVDCRVLPLYICSICGDTAYFVRGLKWQISVLNLHFIVNPL